MSYPNRATLMDLSQCRLQSSAKEWEAEKRAGMRRGKTRLELVNTAAAWPSYSDSASLNAGETV